MPERVILLKLEDITLIKNPSSFDVFYKNKPNKTAHYSTLEAALKEIFEHLIVNKVKRKKRYSASISELRDIITEAKEELDKLLDLNLGCD